VTKLSSMFELADAYPTLSGPSCVALRRAYSIAYGPAPWSVGEELGAKYSMVRDNKQSAVCVTKNVSGLGHGGTRQACLGGLMESRRERAESTDCHSGADRGGQARLSA
jgi:hypothetical protein